ncbi:MAG: hypothetical protein ACO2PN_27760 [Pyrobaculum sp.]|jgi:hypothetical protein
MAQTQKTQIQKEIQYYLNANVLTQEQKQFIEVVMAALREEAQHEAYSPPPPEKYCVPCKAENARICYTINWSVIDKVYGCAILRLQSEPHTRRILVMPGAVLYMITDGPNSWCYTAGELVVVKDIVGGWFSEMHIFPDGDVEKAKAICMS